MNKLITPFGERGLINKMNVEAVAKLAQLKQQSVSIRDNIQENHAVRIHRAISWYEAAITSEIDDIRFINLWISFHACHFVDESCDELSDQVSFREYIDKCVNHDSSGQLYRCLWERYSGPVKSLIKNPFIFAPFWQCQRTGSDKWRRIFEISSVEALNALSRGKVKDLLIIVLDRLFVLKQQVLQGGATYCSQVNREQIDDGIKILSELIPIFIDIMLLNHQDDWGDLAYPVVTKY